MTNISLCSTDFLTAKKADFPARVEMLLLSRGCSKTWLANELGVSRQALHHILKHRKTPKFVSEIAFIFNVSPKWLESGEEDFKQPTNEILTTVSVYSLNNFIATKNITSPSTLDKILLKPENKHKYFAVLFENYPSMLPKFEEGSILIFDENLSPQNGAYVLGNVNKFGIMLRQFFVEGDTIILKPSDSSFDSIKCTCCDILGVLTETRIKF